MTPKNTGWFLFIAAIGMMAALMSNDVGNLESWNAAFQPAFMGNMLAHAGAVIAAFVGGKMIPANKE